MKITKKQREKIIKRAIKEIKRGYTRFLCIAIGQSIRDVLGKPNIENPRKIQRYIPEFKITTAVKYFDAQNAHLWWDTEPKDKKTRLRFLNYLLTGKLPKK